jgi:hypothetical protein
MLEQKKKKRKKKNNGKAKQPSTAHSAGGPFQL